MGGLPLLPQGSENASRKAKAKQQKKNQQESEEYMGKESTLEEAVQSLRSLFQQVETRCFEEDTTIDVTQSKPARDEYKEADIEKKKMQRIIIQHVDQAFADSKWPTENKKKAEFFGALNARAEIKKVLNEAYHHNMEPIGLKFWEKTEYKVDMTKFKKDEEHPLTEAQLKRLHDKKHLEESWEFRLERIKEAMQKMILCDEIDIMGKTMKNRTNTKVIEKDLQQSCTRWISHNLLKQQAINSPENTALLKVIFEVVTMIKEWPEDKKLLNSDDVKNATCSQEQAKRYHEENVFLSMYRVLRDRGVLAEMPQGLYPGNVKDRFGNVQQAQGFKGAINTLMVMPVYGQDKNGMPTLSKVDAVLNAKEANMHINANKKALDYIRNYLPFIGAAQDMNLTIMNLRENNFSHFGKIDMLNAFAQIPLPKELQNYCCFKVGDRLMKYVRMPFGLCISSHVFSLYMVTHMEIAKGRFLSGLIPRCVSDELPNKPESFERMHLGIMHPDKGIREKWMKKYKKIHANVEKEVTITKENAKNPAGKASMVQQAQQSKKIEVFNALKLEYSQEERQVMQYLSVEQHLPIAKFHKWMSTVFMNHDYLLNGLYLTNRHRDIRANGPIMKALGRKQNNSSKGNVYVDAFGTIGKRKARLIYSKFRGRNSVKRNQRTSNSLMRLVHCRRNLDLGCREFQRKDDKLEEELISSKKPSLKDRVVKSNMALQRVVKKTKQQRPKLKFKIRTYAKGTKKSFIYGIRQKSIRKGYSTEHLEKAGRQHRKRYGGKKSQREKETQVENAYEEMPEVYSFRVGIKKGIEKRLLPIKKLVGFGTQMDDVLIMGQRHVYRKWARYLLWYIFTQAQIFTNLSKNDIYGLTKVEFNGHIINLTYTRGKEEEQEEESAPKSKIPGQSGEDVEMHDDALAEEEKRKEPSEDVPMQNEEKKSGSDPQVKGGYSIMQKTPKTVIGSGSTIGATLQQKPMKEKTPKDKTVAPTRKLELNIEMRGSTQNKLKKLIEIWKRDRNNWSTINKIVSFLTWWNHYNPARKIGLMAFRTALLQIVTASQSMLSENVYQRDMIQQSGQEYKPTYTDEQLAVYSQKALEQLDLQKQVLLHKRLEELLDDALDPIGRKVGARAMHNPIGRRCYDVQLLEGNAVYIGQLRIKLDNNKQNLLQLLKQAFRTQRGETTKHKMQEHELISAWRQLEEICEAGHGRMTRMEAFSFEAGTMSNERKWVYIMARAIEVSLWMGRCSDIVFHVKVGTSITQPQWPIVTALHQFAEELWDQRDQKVLFVKYAVWNCTQAIQRTLSMKEEPFIVLSIFQERNQALIQKNENIGEISSEIIRRFCAQLNGDEMQIQAIMAQQMEEGKKLWKLAESQQFPITYYLQDARCKRDKVIYERFYQEAELWKMGAESTLIFKIQELEWFLNKKVRDKPENQIKRILSRLQEKQFEVSQSIRLGIQKKYGLDLSREKGQQLSKEQMKDYKQLTLQILNSLPQETCLRLGLINNQQLYSTLTAMDIALYGESKLSYEVQKLLAVLIMDCGPILAYTPRAVVAAFQMLDIMMSRQQKVNVKADDPLWKQCLFNMDKYEYIHVPLQWQLLLIVQEYFLNVKGLNVSIGTIAVRLQDEVKSLIFENVLRYARNIGYKLFNIQEDLDHMVHDMMLNHRIEKVAEIITSKQADWQRVAKDLHNLAIGKKCGLPYVWLGNINEQAWEKMYMNKDELSVKYEMERFKRHALSNHATLGWGVATHFSSDKHSTSKDSNPNENVLRISSCIYWAMGIAKLSNEEGKDKSDEEAKRLVEEVVKKVLQNTKDEQSLKKFVVDYIEKKPDAILGMKRIKNIQEFIHELIMKLTQKEIGDESLTSMKMRMYQEKEGHDDKRKQRGSFPIWLMKKKGYSIRQEMLNLHAVEENMAEQIMAETTELLQCNAYHQRHQLQYLCQRSRMQYIEEEKALLKAEQEANEMWKNAQYASVAQETVYLSDAIALRAMGISVRNQELIAHKLMYILENLNDLGREEQEMKANILNLLRQTSGSSRYANGRQDMMEKANVLVEEKVQQEVMQQYNDKALTQDDRRKFISREMDTAKLLRSDRYLIQTIVETEKQRSNENVDSYEVQRKVTEKMVNDTTDDPKEKFRKQLLAKVNALGLDGQSGQVSMKKDERKKPFKSKAAQYEQSGRASREEEDNVVLKELLRDVEKDKGKAHTRTEVQQLMSQSGEKLDEIFAEKKPYHQGEKKQQIKKHSKGEYEQADEEIYRQLRHNDMVENVMKERENLQHESMVLTQEYEENFQDAQDLVIITHYDKETSEHLEDESTDDDNAHIKRIKEFQERNEHVTKKFIERIESIIKADKEKSEAVLKSEEDAVMKDMTELPKGLQKEISEAEKVLRVLLDDEAKGHLNITGYEKLGNVYNYWFRKTSQDVICKNFEEERKEDMIQKRIYWQKVPQSGISIPVQEDLFAKWQAVRAKEEREVLKEGTNLDCMCWITSLELLCAVAKCDIWKLIYRRTPLMELKPKLKYSLISRESQRFREERPSIKLRILEAVAYTVQGYDDDRREQLSKQFWYWQLACDIYDNLTEQKKNINPQRKPHLEEDLWLTAMVNGAREEHMTEYDYSEMSEEDRERMIQDLEVYELCLSLPCVWRCLSSRPYADGFWLQGNWAQLDTTEMKKEVLQVMSRFNDQNCNLKEQYKIAQTIIKGHTPILITQSRQKEKTVELRDSQDSQRQEGEEQKVWFGQKPDMANIIPESQMSRIGDIERVNTPNTQGINELNRERVYDKIKPLMEVGEYEKDGHKELMEITRALATLFLGLSIGSQQYWRFILKELKCQGWRSYTKENAKIRLATVLSLMLFGICQNEIDIAQAHTKGSLETQARAAVKSWTEMMQKNLQKQKWCRKGSQQDVKAQMLASYKILNDCGRICAELSYNDGKLATPEAIDKTLAQMSQDEKRTYMTWQIDPQEKKAWEKAVNASEKEAMRTLKDHRNYIELVGMTARLCEANFQSEKEKSPNDSATNTRLMSGLNIDSSSSGKKDTSGPGGLKIIRKAKE